MKTIPAKNLMCTIAANVNNPLLTDEQFREFVRNNAGICQEVLEWREAMAQLGKDFNTFQHNVTSRGKGGKCGNPKFDINPEFSEPGDCRK